MKFNFRGIRFKTWLSFTAFAVAILSLLWILLEVFLDPYYRSIKVNSMQNIARTIDVVIEPYNANIAFDLSKIARDRSICFYLVNEQGNATQFDGMGIDCYISKANINNRVFSLSDFVKEIKDSPKNEVQRYVTNERYGNEMIVYGTRISKHLGSYYLVVNSGIEPIEYGSYIIRQMYGILTIFVILFATIASFLISKNMSRPVIEMTESAQRLATGDYTVNFNAGSSRYQEMETLGKTLNYATKELAMIEDLRKDLIANVSHDIKTPLTMIKAYAEMISDFSGDDKAKREEHLAVIINEVNHLDRLVNDMLELSKLQSGSLTLNKETINLKTVVEEMVTVFSGMASLQSCELVITGISDAFVVADSVKIGQVVYNFISNSLKHVGDDRKVIINLSAKQKRIRLEVIDHGKGIPKDQIDKIWDRYYKIDKNYQRNQEGSGLGLSIAKGILDAHHANYGVESEVNKGSTFWFELEQVDG